MEHLHRLQIGLVLHAHVAIWEEGTNNSKKNTKKQPTIKHGPEILSLLEVINLFPKVAMLHCKGPH